MDELECVYEEKRFGVFKDIAESVILKIYSQDFDRDTPIISIEFNYYTWKDILKAFGNSELDEYKDRLIKLIEKSS